MRFSLKFTAAVLLLSACALLPPPPETANYPSGKPRYSVAVDSAGKKNGRETWWYENGNRKYQADNLHGARGPYQAWYPDGKPWYRGRDSLGLAQDTLMVWYPNGRPRTVSVFRNGVQLHYEGFDSIEKVDSAAIQLALEAARDAARKRQYDSLQASQNTREAGIAEWSKRVRATVEPNWSLPKEMLKVPERAVARIRVRRDGEILGLFWVEKSPSKTFNSLAERAVMKAKKFPPFPDPVKDATLDLQYEFVTPGLQPPRRKLQLRAPPLAGVADSVSLPAPDSSAAAESIPPGSGAAAAPAPADSSAAPPKTAKPIDPF